MWNLNGSVRDDDNILRHSTSSLGETQHGKSPIIDNLLPMLESLYVAICGRVSFKRGAKAQKFRI